MAIEDFAVGPGEETPELKLHALVHNMSAGEEIWLLVCFLPAERTGVGEKFPRIFWKDRELRFLGANPYFLQDIRPDALSRMREEQLIRRVEPGMTLYRHTARELKTYVSHRRRFVFEDQRVLTLGRPMLDIIETMPCGEGQISSVRTQKAPLMDSLGRIHGILGAFEHIPASRAVTQALARSLQQREMLEQIVDMSPSIAIMSAITREGDWQVQYISNSVSSLGYTPELFIQEGKRFQDLIHPEDQERVLKSQRLHIRQGEPFCQQEYRLLTADGRMRDIREHITFQYMSEDYTIAQRILTDITQERSHTRSLRDAHQAMQTVTDNLHTAVFVSSLGDRQILFANAAFKRIFGEQVVGRPCYEVVFGTFAPRCATCLSKLIAGECRVEEGEDYFENQQKWMGTKKMLITWTGGEEAYLTVMDDVSENIRQRQRMETEAAADFLTGLKNRRGLAQDFERAVDQARQEGGRGYVFFLDLDDFKHVNDTLGHEAGDLLLRQVAGKLRAYEAFEGHVYRYGGDEFVALIPPAYAGEMERVAESLLAQFRRPWDLSGVAYPCTMSLGIAEYPRHGHQIEELLRRVDMTMYEAKHKGKNCVCHYREQDDQLISRKELLEKGLRETIGANFQGFSLAYQPFFRGKDQKLEGMEALLRWQYPGLGAVPTLELVTLAESMSLMPRLGEFAIGAACRDLRRWREETGLDLTVNINLSVQQLRVPYAAEQIIRLVSESGLAAKHVLFDITQSQIGDQEGIVLPAMRKLSEAGFTFALDDFGMTPQTLSDLEEMPLDFVKLDKTFIARLSEKPELWTPFLRALIQMARSLGIRASAQGVETEAQRELLKALEIDRMQGFLYGKPLDAAAFKESYLGQVAK